MAESPLTPECSAPSCRELGELRFLGLTPLCRRHMGKAHRRAMVNVLTVGPLLAGASAAVLWGAKADSTRFLFGMLVLGAGILVSLSAGGFWLRARNFAG